MIETWQYVALGGFVAAVLAVLQYSTSRTRERDRLFFSTMEAAVVRALAAQHFVLARKEYLPKSLGHRWWQFERPPSAIRVFWDARERGIIVEMHELGAPKPIRRPIAAFSIPIDSSPERYGRVLDDLLESIEAAVRADAQSPRAPS